MMIGGVRLVADHEWRGRWLPAPEVMGAEPAQPTARTVRIRGTLLPDFRDHHVHLGLVDPEQLNGSRLSAVDDLGWDPAVAEHWRQTSPGGCRVRIAGPFLTAPGGYPAGRSWAPELAVWPLADVPAVRRAVADLATLGVDCLKVALHAAMPVLDDAQLAALAHAAADLELPVVVHAEGLGQVARAAAIAPAALAHTPWTERVPDALIRAMAGRTAWISTLAIHRDGPGARVAADNLIRFHRAGGEIRYGTDLGNGPGPVDLNLAEIAAMVVAGLDADAILTSLCREHLDRRPTDTVTWTPYAPVQDPSDLTAWLATVRRRPVSDLEGAP